MRLNALNMPGNICNEISNNRLTAGTVSNYDSDGLGGSALVTWVESHDNFYNDGNWKMPDSHIKRAWAAIAAQPINCLYLARPYGYSDSNKSATGSNDIRLGGNGTYYDAEVAAVNKFHTAMDGQSSYVENVNGNTQVLAVKRGTAGVCFVNAGASDITLSNYYTGMANGTLPRTPSSPTAISTAISRIRTIQAPTTTSTQAVLSQLPLTATRMFISTLSEQTITQFHM